MATAEEILETMEEEATSEVIVVNNDLRTLTIPESIVILGVENDDDVVSMPFRMPRHFKEIDLGEFALRINYMNANGEADVYPVTDKTVGDEYIDFSWLVGKPAVKYKGKTKFVVCARLLGENDVKKEFNTTTASLPVLEGLEASSAVAQQNPDIIENILLRLNKLEVGGGSGGAGIDDETSSTETTYSSSKIDALLNEQKEAIDNKVGTDELNTAVEDALTTAKESGAFDGEPGAPGEPGKDYVLTEEDKQEIAGMVEGPSYTLPVANETTLGGVKPAAKTEEMTQAVGVDEQGGLWALPGGASGYELLMDVTTEEDVGYLAVSFDEQRSYTDFFIMISLVGSEKNASAARLWQFAMNAKPSTWWNEGIKLNLFVNNTSVDKTYYYVGHIKVTEGMVYCREFIPNTTGFSNFASGESNNSSENTVAETQKARPLGDMGVEASRLISGISIGGQGANTGIGSRFRVWGVRG